MPGLVVAVKVAPGDEVKTDQGLVIIEAMKMENELFAKFPARVKEVKVKPKEAVERNQPLIIFE
jgi:biotin carboxyl carrier protein